MKPVFLVIGAGAGIGGTVGKKFAREGYHAVLCRRSDAAGLRKLVQGIEEEGIHVAHILIDGAVDAPDTLGKMLGPERFQQLREERGLAHDGLLLPSEVAETYYHIAHQHRSAWTHEIDLRAFSDRPWWNH